MEDKISIIGRKMDEEIKENLDFEEELKLDEFELESRKWKNRRYMAWGAFAMLPILLGVAILLPEARLKLMDNILTTMIFGDISIIGFYFGSATYASRK